ncbi:MAG: hypothetical protein WEF99_07470 [Thermoanaerobaculia bacterium]
MIREDLGNWNPQFGQRTSSQPVCIGQVPHTRPPCVNRFPQSPHTNTLVSSGGAGCAGNGVKGVSSGFI